MEIIKHLHSLRRKHKRLIAWNCVSKVTTITTVTIFSAYQHQVQGQGPEDQFEHRQVWGEHDLGFSRQGISGCRDITWYHIDLIFGSKSWFSQAFLNPLNQSRSRIHHQGFVRTNNGRKIRILNIAFPHLFHQTQTGLLCLFPVMKVNVFMSPFLIHFDQISTTLEIPSEWPIGAFGSSTCQRHQVGTELFIMFLRVVPSVEKVVKVGFSSAW